MAADPFDFVFETIITDNYTKLLEDSNYATLPKFSGFPKGAENIAMGKTKVVGKGAEKTRNASEKATVTHTARTRSQIGHSSVFVPPEFPPRDRELPKSNYQEKKAVSSKKGKEKDPEPTPAQIKKRKEDTKLLKPMYGRTVQRETLPEEITGEGTESDSHALPNVESDREGETYTKKRKTVAGESSKSLRADSIDFEIVIKSFNSVVTNISDRIDEMATSQKHLANQVKKLADALTAFVSQGTGAGLQERQAYNRALLKAIRRVGTVIDEPRFKDETDEVEVISELVSGGQKYNITKVRKLCEKPGELKPQQKNEIVEYLKVALVQSGRNTMTEHVTTNVFEKPGALHRLLNLLNR